MPEKSAPANTLSRLTQRAYQIIVALIALYLLYLFALQLLYYRSTGQIEVARTVISNPDSGTITELHVNEMKFQDRFYPVPARARPAVLPGCASVVQFLHQILSVRAEPAESTR